MNTTAGQAVGASAPGAPSGLFTFSNRRTRAVWLSLFCLGLFAALLISASLIGDAGMKTNFRQKSISPCIEHPFGTDPLGRDMLARTIKGLRRSLLIGMGAALVSTIVAVFLGLSAAVFGAGADKIVTGVVDMIISMPHLVLMILISFAMGGGVKGVVVSVALTHWVRLARIIRAEVLQLKTSQFVQLSSRLGGPKSGSPAIICCLISSLSSS